MGLWHYLKRTRSRRRACLVHRERYLQPIHLVDRGRTSGGRAVLELVEPFAFSQSLNGGGLSVSVPAGFATDFASIPRVLWPLFNPAGPWRRAAVIHDYLYTRAASCPRFLADAVFRHAMELEGVGLATRLLIYYAVRLFGGPSYHRK